jgi:tRNA(fMet)-specific endonuclease VapC
MSFLLDTNICSAHLKRPAGLMHRFVQYSGRLYIPTVVLGELYAWAYKRSHPRCEQLIHLIEDDLLRNVMVLEFDSDCAREFGRVRGALIQRGDERAGVDLLIASVALCHDLTLVTHNTADFQHIPDLRLVDWLV